MGWTGNQPEVRSREWRMAMWIEASAEVESDSRRAQPKSHVFRWWTIGGTELSYVGSCQDEVNEGRVSNKRNL